MAGCHAFDGVFLAPKSRWWWLESSIVKSCGFGILFNSKNLVIKRLVPQWPQGVPFLVNDSQSSASTGCESLNSVNSRLKMFLKIACLLNIYIQSSYHYSLNHRLEQGFTLYGYGKSPRDDLELTGECMWVLCKF
jgi:disulfide bond formation protein DsbB